MPGKERITLEEALTRAVMVVAGQRDGSILVQCAGFFTGQPQGPRLIGEELGLERLTINRICLRARHAVNERSDPPPLLQRALNLVSESAPCTSEHAEDLLKTEGITRVRFTPEALVNAAVLYALPCPFRVRNARGLRGVVPAGSGRGPRQRFFVEQTQPAHRWRTFRSARAFARRLGLNSKKEWFAWLRGELPEKGECPSDIPAGPVTIYGKELFRGWGDFLGTGNSGRTFRSFEEARKFVRKLRLGSFKEWRIWSRGDFPGKPKRPADIPSEPHRKYRGQGWLGWGDFLGTGNVAGGPQRSFRSFGVARDFTRGLHLRSRKEWMRWSKGELSGKGERPADIPGNPAVVYREQGWKGWGDFLGTGKLSTHYRTWRSFRSARAFARKLRFKSAVDWGIWSRGDLPEKGKRPVDIPSAPARIYRDRGWEGWTDFLHGKRRRTARRP